jgi:peptide/nickel transport system permease protein
MSSAPFPPPPALLPRRMTVRIRGVVKRGPLGLTVGLAILVVILLASYALPLAHDPLAADPIVSLQPPSGDHWFGTDTIGRDAFARVVRSGRTDLPLALLGTLAALVIGVALGLLVSVKRRASEWAMRGLDMFQSFPLLILAVAIISLAQNQLGYVVLAIAMIFAPLFVRLVRSEALALRESRFIEAAVAIGASRSRLMVRHILPNVTGIILVQAALTASRAVLLIAALSFLGIGITPPTPSWGGMIQQGSAQIASGQWWISVFPGIFVVLCVLAFNLVADGLEVVLGRGARG